MPKGLGGYQPDTKAPSSRRADFNLLRRVAVLERNGGGTPGGEPNWPDGYPTYDSRYVNVDGDTMTGPLVIPGPPTTGGQAANKDYVDSLIAGLEPGTIILDGPGPPASNTGNVGDYYADTLNGVLYGPKGSGSGVANAVLNEPFNNLGNWTGVALTTVVTGRTGTAAQTTASGSGAAYMIPAVSESDWIIVGFAFNSNGTTADRQLLRLRSDAAVTEHLRFVLGSTGTLFVFRGSSSLITSAPIGVLPGTWAYIEIQARLHDSQGQVVVRVNGVQQLIVANVDTKNGGTKTTFDSVALAGANGINQLYDDMYIKTGSGATFAGDTTITGDPWPVTVRRLPDGSVTTVQIADNAVTNAKLADVPTATFKGRVTAASGDPEDLTATQATSMLNVFTSALKGLTPLSGGGTTNFLRADGTWAPPPAGGGSPDWTLGYPTYDPRYVNVDGDTMTGALIVSPSTNVAGLILRRPDEQPSMNWQLLDGTRLGYIQVSGSEFKLFADGADPMTFYTNGTETFRIRANTTGEILTVAGSPDNYMRFRSASPSGTAQGYVGYVDSWLRMVGDANPVTVQSGAAQECRIAAGYPLTFYCNTAERARFDSNGNFMLGKTSIDAGTLGAQFTGDGGVLAVNNAITNTPSLICGKNGAGVAAGHDYVHFRTNNSNIGSITRNASTSAVLYNTTSDYRLKEGRGLITGARERIKVLRPRRVVWKDDPTQTEVDGFFAHEVAEVVPDAVTGEQDAEEMQQMDATRLIPLLVAAVQELTTEVEQLRAEVAQLKGAA